MFPGRSFFFSALLIDLTKTQRHEKTEESIIDPTVRWGKGKPRLEGLCTAGKESCGGTSGKDLTKGLTKSEHCSDLFGGWFAFPEVMAH